MFGGDFRLPPGPDMGSAPRVVHRPLSTYCLRHAVAPRRPSYRIVEVVPLNFYLHNMHMHMHM